MTRKKPVPVAGKRSKKETNALGNEYPQAFTFVPAVGTYTAEVQFTRDGWERVSK